MCVSVYAHVCVNVITYANAQEMRASSYHFEAQSLLLSLLFLLSLSQLGAEFSQPSWKPPTVILLDRRTGLASVTTGLHRTPGLLPGCWQLNSAPHDFTAPTTNAFVVVCLCSFKSILGKTVNVNHILGTIELCVNKFGDSKY